MSDSENLQRRGYFYLWNTAPARRRSGFIRIRCARPSLKFSCQTTLGSLPWRTIWWSDERANYVWSSLANRIETLPSRNVYGEAGRLGDPFSFPELFDQRFTIDRRRARTPHLASLPPMMLLSNQVVDDTDYYHLTLKNGAAMPDQSYDLWIAKSDLLIRKFAYRIGGGWHEEVHRNLQLNVELPDDTFRIAAPGS